MLGKLPDIKARRAAIATAITIMLASGFQPFISNLLAATINNWPAQMKALYIDNCSQKIASKGMTQHSSRQYCTCLADGMEEEFGTEEYEQMRLSKPSATGSAHDRRLYKIFDACKGSFPKSPRTIHRFSPFN